MTSGTGIKTSHLLMIIERHSVRPSKRASETRLAGVARQRLFLARSWLMTYSPDPPGGIIGDQQRSVAGHS
jgi:hypothetical protein